MEGKKIIGIPSEIWIQIGLALVFFVGTAVGHENDINYHGVWIYVNYLLAAFIINYWLLPTFFYQRKYVAFGLAVLVVLLIAIVIEEFWLEKMIFPNTRRGDTFPGVIRSLTMMMPILMVFVGFKFAWDLQTKERQLEKMQSAVTESQLQFLNSQINPHFLFNNLNNLYSYALENSPKTPKIILELSSILRYMLYDCREKYVPIEKEVESLNNFIKLQSLQIEERGDINFNRTGELSNQRIAPLILIVFVENCFKHSTSSMTERINIDISLHGEGNKVTMECANVYSESPNTENLSNGIGLENVKKRLELMYPARHALKVSDDDNVFRVHLEINLN
ncbi:MAG: two-component system LytT family sensor kinase [Saprospiraceae bacterium]|jgi:two-component system LytT family sensor kinase